MADSCGTASSSAENTARLTALAIAGVEASASWRTVDFYVEAEYVPTSSRENSYTYAWSELGWRPAYPSYREGLAAILAAERTG